MPNALCRSRLTKSGLANYPISSNQIQSIKTMNTTSEAFYDRVAPLYPVIDCILKPQKQRLFYEINSYPPGKLLDIGVGNGAHLKYYTRHAVVGVDRSEGMIAAARKHQRENIQLLQMDGEALEFPDESFDHVILSHVIAVVEHPDKLLKEVHRVLKPHGKVFILNHFTPVNWLKYLDLSFARISRLLHFRSVFRITDLEQIRKFRLLSERKTDLFSYFKLLIYEKNV